MVLDGELRRTMSILIPFSVVSHESREQELRNVYYWLVAAYNPGTRNVLMVSSSGQPGTGLISAAVNCYIELLQSWSGDCFASTSTPAARAPSSFILLSSTTE